MQTAPIIQLQNVHLAYPSPAAEPVQALRGITLSINQGEHVCILGSNGSGKSSLIQLLNALMLPTSGTVRVMGSSTLDPAGAAKIRTQAAMVFQHPEDQMTTSIVADDVAFGPENLGVPREQIIQRVDAALAAVGMGHLAQADPADLSGGQKQRVAIAGALAMDPQILLLDEPAAMLDTDGRRSIQHIVNALKRRGITVVHVTHFMDDALLADRVIVLDQGRVALDGTPHQVFSHHDLINHLGLELPFAMRLSQRLRAAGINVPLTADEDQLARCLAAMAPAVPSHAAGPLASGTRASGPCASGPCAATTSHAAGPRSDDRPAIAFRDVTYSYAQAASARKKHRRPLFRRSSKTRPAGPLALQGVDFSLSPGTLTALAGHTGSGKSTTLELACALKVPLAGSVQVNGIDTANLDLRPRLRKEIGYVSQLPERQLFAQTVYEDVAFGPRNLGLDEDQVRERVMRALAATGLEPQDELLNRSPFALSGGQQRCVALAGILAMRQPVLVLDEPMAGLDPRGRDHVRALLRTLKEQGTALLVVTHSMDDVAELADRLVVLDHGRVAADGAPRAVFTAQQDALACIGVPSAQAFAERLAALGLAVGTLGGTSACEPAGEPVGDTASKPASESTGEASDIPLTLDELVASLTEVLPHGTAR